MKMGAPGASRIEVLRRFEDWFGTVPVHSCALIFIFPFAEPARAGFKLVDTLGKMKTSAHKRTAPSPEPFLRIDRVPQFGVPRAPIFILPRRSTLTQARSRAVANSARFFHEHMAEG